MHKCSWLSVPQWQLCISKCLTTMWLIHAASAPSTHGEVPGGAGRWTLTDVNTGLDSMAAMYTKADSMANDFTLYTTLQGITMQLLILRLIKVLSAQKRLSILTTTAVKVRRHFSFSYCHLPAGIHEPYKVFTAPLGVHESCYLSGIT